MGTDRKWIVLSYIAITASLAWVLNQFVTLGLHQLHLSNPSILGVMPASALGSVVVMAIAGYIYFQQPKVSAFSSEVFQEMRKVSWPARKVVSASTVVVVVAVVIMAVVIGLFDFICAGLIGWILRV